MARRSYGSGRLYARTDAAGRESWYGIWYSGGQRIKRKVGPKRQRGGRDGLTAAQAERELQRRMESERPVARSRLCLGDVAAALPGAPGARLGAQADHARRLPLDAPQAHRTLLRRAPGRADRRRPDRPLHRRAKSAKGWRRRRSPTSSLSCTGSSPSPSSAAGCRRTRSPSSTARAAPSGDPDIHYPRPGRTRGAAARRPRRLPRPDRPRPLSDRRDDRPAPGRADRAALARRRLAGRRGSGCGATTPARRFGTPEVEALLALGADGRPGRAASWSATTSAPPTRATTTSSSATRRPATRSTPPSCASASRRR